MKMEGGGKVKSGIIYHVLSATWFTCFQVTKSGEPVTDLWSDRQHKLPFEMIWIFASSQNTIKIPGKTNWNLASYNFSV